MFGLPHRPCILVYQMTDPSVFCTTNTQRTQNNVSISTLYNLRYCNSFWELHNVVFCFLSFCLFSIILIIVSVWTNSSASICSYLVWTISVSLLMKFALIKHACRFWTSLTWFIHWVFSFGNISAYSKVNYFWNVSPMPVNGMISIYSPWSEFSDVILGLLSVIG